MRLHRLLVRNWRGVEEREVHFAATGVTVVEGPNESGKSSLVEALDALIEHLDDSKKREVAAIKPVHKDVGAEVEAEIETGPYRFTYSKRFHKKSETKLTVTTPRPENLTGREAHERALQILDETMDRGLWAALRIEQGQLVTQANLSEQKSLSAALDRAAGIARTGEAEETLYSAAQAEYSEYFTAKGAERRETGVAEAEVERLKLAAEKDVADLARLVADVERSAALDRDAIDATGALAESVASQERHENRQREIERLEASAGEAKFALDGATERAKQAEQRQSERVGLIDAARASAHALSELTTAGELDAPAFAGARHDLHAADAAFGVALEAAERAEREGTVNQQDLEFWNETLHLRQLGARKNRIDAADAAAAQAEAVLANNAVTDGVLKKLHASNLDLEKARAALTAGSPEFHLRALEDINPSIGGTLRPMSKGGEATIQVEGSVVLLLPGVAEIEIRTGSSIASLRDAFDEKRRRFSDLCHAAVASDLEAAVCANAAWQAARRDIESRDRTLADDLGDLSRGELAQKVSSLTLRLAAYPEARVATFPMPGDFDAARQADRIAKATSEAAKRARNDAERRREAARREDTRLREVRTHAEIAQAEARSKAQVTAQQLAQSRAAVSEESLAQAATMARDSQSEAERVHGAASASLAAAQPEAARLLAENARGARQRAKERLRSIEDEQIEVRARLKERGEEGIAERVDASETKHARARGDLARRRVHAAAAKLLFETLDAERAAARTRYIAPLREQIERLGSIVFGTSFSVELGEDLQISQRTLGGRTVPFDSLSGGAKEQLGVISRLACALIVAKDGGVPVVFDDTLGNTDPTRIETMGALLNLAGRSCQVILLTCVPDRFRHVGAARVVRAGAASTGSF